MHVVHQDHDASPGEQPREERHAVLHLEDGVVTAEATGEKEQCCPEVDRQVPAAAHVADAVTGLGRRGSRVASGEHRESDAARAQPPGDLGDVELRTAGLGVPGIAPVEHEHPASRSGHLSPFPGCDAVAGRCCCDG